MIGMKILVMKDKGGDGIRAGHQFETIVILTDYRFFFFRSDLVQIFIFGHLGFFQEGSTP